MKIVYELVKEVDANPQSVIDTHALTLDASRPRLGLKGNRGLYATEEWWDSIYQNEMETIYVSGLIVDAFIAGQNSCSNNEVDVRMSDGSVRTIGIYFNCRADASMYKAGCRLDVIYARDELKDQPHQDGGVNYLEIVLEVAVSLEPVAK